MIEEAVILGLPFLLAMIAALCVPVLGIVHLRLSATVPADLRVALVFAAVALGAMGTVALTPRLLNEALFKPEFVFASDFAGSDLSSRLLSAALVAAALVEIIRSGIPTLRRPFADASAPVLVGLLAFYVGVPLFQLVGSEHPGFKPRSMYAPVVLTALCLLHIERIDRVMVVAKVGVFACALGSLLSAVVAPDFAMARPSPSVIPGVNFRLYGLAPHPNALGPIALVGLMLELHMPWRRRSLHWLQLACAALTFALAQSKTAWVAALVIALLTWLPLSVLPARQPQLQARSFGRAALTLMGCMLALAATAVAVSQFDLQRYFARNSSLLTLTGRLEIWSITLAEWHRNLFFGYGPDLWSPEYMKSQNMLAVGQAHNQFVQTLGEAGLMGLCMLLIYVGTLTFASVRCFRASRGLVLALFTLLLLRCVTEASLRSEGLLNWTFFTHALLVVLACHHLRAAAPAPAQVRNELQGRLEVQPGS